MTVTQQRLSFCTDCPAGAMTERGLIIHRAIKHGAYIGGVPLEDRHLDEVQFNFRLDAELHSHLCMASENLEISKAEVVRTAIRQFVDAHFEELTALPSEGEEE